MTGEYRLVEECNKGCLPYWYIEEYRWGLFGKGWYYLQNITSVGSLIAEEKFDRFVEESKKMSYKKVLKQSI